MDCSALSPSRINTNKDCEFKYFLTYHLRLPEARESNIYGVKGTAAHLALELYINAKRGLKEQACEDYEKTLKDFYRETELWKLDDRQGQHRDGRPKGWPHPVEKYCETCPYATKDGVCEIAGIPYEKVEGCPYPNFADDLEIVRDTIENDDVGLFDSGKVLGTEVEFNEEIDGVVLRGVIDLVKEVDENTLEIIDFKSGNSTKGYDAARKDPQMRIYSMIAKKLWPGYTTYLTSLYYIRKKKYVTCIFSEEDDKGTFKATARHWNNIKTNDDPYRPNNPIWLCNFCVGHDVCGVIKESHTRKGRFKLPTIDCAHRDENCWGGLGAENPGKVTASNTHEMTYACRGHIKIHKGGEYVPEPDGGETAR